MSLYDSTWKYLALLLFIFAWVYDAKGSYVVEITIHSYDNPEGRSCESNTNCYQSTSQTSKCCEENFIRLRNQSCPESNTCDTRVAYCFLPLRSTQPCRFSDMTKSEYVQNTNTINSIGNRFINLDNPIVFEGRPPWRGIQFFLQSEDFDFNNGFEIIDVFILDIDTNTVGTSSPERTYTGLNRLAQINISFSVRCGPMYYGQVCSVHCRNFQTCAQCGLSGFTGEFCQNIDDCVGVTCSGNGRCVDGIDSFMCECDDNYTGDNCESIIDHCVGINCSGNGQCQNSVDGYKCECDNNYTGDNCESIIDHCVGINCSGNGQCRNSVDGYSCECDPDYTGKFCGSRIDNCFGITECLNVTPGDTGARTGPIVGGVVGGFLVVIVIILIAVFLLIIIARTQKGKAYARSESNESEFIPGDNPVYDIGAETDYTTLPEEVGEQDSRTRGNTRQLSFDEREFDNPIYASEIEGDNHYDDLEVLPPHLYDRVYSNW